MNKILSIAAIFALSASSVFAGNTNDPVVEGEPSVVIEKIGDNFCAKSPAGAAVCAATAALVIALLTDGSSSSSSSSSSSGS